MSGIHILIPEKNHKEYRVVAQFWFCASNGPIILNIEFSTKILFLTIQKACLRIFRLFHIITYTHESFKVDILPFMLHLKIRLPISAILYEQILAEAIFQFHIVFLWCDITLVF